VIPVTGRGCTSVDIGVNANQELVDKFLYPPSERSERRDIVMLDSVCPSFCH